MQTIHKVKDFEIFNKVIDVSEAGPTHRAKNIRTNQTCLILVLDSNKVEDISQKNGSDFVSELLVFQKLKGENLLNTQEILRTENHIYVIFQFPEEMNLQTIIDSKGYFPEDRLMPLFTDILIGYLPYFKGKTLHRNILSKNIYKSNDRFKLLNFPYTQSLGNKGVSSYFYFKNGVPPMEILDSYQINTSSSKVDIWAIGCVFYEAVFGVVPFSGKDSEELLINIENAIKNRKRFLEELPNPKGIKAEESLRDLLEKMLQFYPDDRIDFPEILKHEFLQKKKAKQLFHVADYFKQMKHNLENDLDIFKNLDLEFKASLKTCFSLCEVDRLKLNELDILETLKNLPNQYGFSCEMIFRMTLLETICQEPEEKTEKRRKHGDFPYKTRAESQKTMQLNNEGIEDLPIEVIESDDDENEKNQENPQMKNNNHGNILAKNMEKMDGNLADLKVGFKEKILHELEIIRFIEETGPTLKQALDVNDNLSNLMGFILNKYLFIRIEVMRNCLAKKENLFSMDNWESQIMYLNFDVWLDSLKKASSRANQNMNSDFEKINTNQIKDKKLIPFLNLNLEVSPTEEKTYVRVFLKLVLDVKDLLEKNNQKMLSKYGYGVILKFFYFVHIYETFGFFKMDRENKFNIINMTQNVAIMDKEKMKKEIVEFLKKFLQKD